jgi:hypothetical protein
MEEMVEEARVAHLVDVLVGMAHREHDKLDLLDQIHHDHKSQSSYDESTLVVCKCEGNGRLISQCS